MKNIRGKEGRLLILRSKLIGLGSRKGARSMFIGRESLKREGKRIGGTE
jgi:hypothetical protein